MGQLEVFFLVCTPNLLSQTQLQLRSLCNKSQSRRQLLAYFPLRCLLEPDLHAQKESRKALMFVETDPAWDPDTPIPELADVSPSFVLSAVLLAGPLKLCLRASGVS